MDEEFEAVWQALVENGTSRRNKEPTFRYWLSLSLEQRHLACLNITRKARENSFLNYNPIQAIKENIRKKKADEPTNLNHTARGGTMLNSGLAEIAFYNGSWGVYSQEDIKKFNLITKNVKGMVR